MAIPTYLNDKLPYQSVTTVYTTNVSITHQYVAPF